MRSHKFSVGWAAFLTAIFMVIAACSSCDSSTEVQPSPSATAVQVDSYEEVIALPIGTHIEVTEGLLILTGTESAKLCLSAEDSDPPACGDHGLELIGVTEESDLTWRWEVIGGQPDRRITYVNLTGEIIGEGVVKAEQVSSE